MSATTTETVDYSKYGGKYNKKFQRWEWTNDRGQHHRQGDQPALIFDNGTEIWCEDGVPHRLSGKAWIVKDGSGYDAWFIKGVRYDTEEEFLDKVRFIQTPGRLTKRATPT